MVAIELLRQDLLDRGNWMRRHHGIPEIPELLPGTPQNPCGCGIERLIEPFDPNVFVWTSYVQISAVAAPLAMAAFAALDAQNRYVSEVLPDGRVQFQLADMPRRFVAAFDQRRMPDLIDTMADADFRRRQAAAKAALAAV